HTTPPQETPVSRLLFALLTIAALSIAAPAQQPQGSSAAMSGARAEVQKFVRDYIDANNRADATSLSEAMSRRPEVTSVNEGTIVRGWEAIRTSTDEIVGKQGSFNISIGTMD